MADKPRLVSSKPTALPDRYDRLFAWNLDRRCSVVRAVSGDLQELWQDLGGVEHLSAQQRWLCERVVFIRRRCLDYESDVIAGRVPIMDVGTYSNHANVLQGYLRSTLGLDRVARQVKRLSDHIQAAP